MIWSGPVGLRFVSLEDVLAGLLDLLPHSPHAAMQTIEHLLLRSPHMQSQLRAYCQHFAGNEMLHGGENGKRSPQTRAI